MGLAGYGAFHAVDESDDKGTIGKNVVSDGFSAHAALGYIIFLAALVLLVLALIARRAGGPGRLKWSGAILGLVVVQILLAWAGSASAWLGALHGVNALAVAGGARAPDPEVRV